jgi:drug/metabolite transporter (DMT)-like permease
MFDLSKRTNQWILLFVLSFIWGASFILMKKALRSFDMFEVSSLRIFIAFLVIFPFAFFRYKKLKHKHFWPMLEVAFIGNAIPMYLFTYSQQYIDSALAGILNSTTPIFAFLLAVFFFKHKMNWLKVVGLTIGTIGTIGLLLAKGVEAFTLNSLYISAILLATMMYAINVNVVKEFLQDLDGLTITTFTFTILGPFAFVDLLLKGTFYKITLPETHNDLLYIILLAIFGSVLAVIGINYLINYSSAVFASSVTYIIPVFAILWGIYDNEKITFLQIFWMVVIISGTYLLNKTKLE